MSIIHKQIDSETDFAWEDVAEEHLSEEGLRSIKKHVLIGSREGAQNYIMRYFRVEPDGHSRLEHHPQEHEVLILHGKGQVQIADNIYPLSPFDVVFIESNELHQFSNPGQEAFGFICVIPKNAK